MVEIVDFHESKFWKVPEQEFSDILKGYGIKKIGEHLEFYLNFGIELVDDEEIEKDMVFRGLRKLKEDGRISDFFALGKLIQSMRNLGIKADLEGEEENIKITFIPSIIDKKLTMSFDPVKDRKVTSEDSEKIYHTWFLKSVDGLNAKSAAIPIKDIPAQIKVTPTAMLESWRELLLIHLTTPMNENGIIKLCTTLFPDADKRKPYSDTRKASLAALVKEGWLEIDGDAKYNVKK